MAYAELHCRTYFSFLDGASSPEELIARAVHLGLPALAVTDVNGLYGVVEAREALLDRFGLTKRHEEGAAPLKLIHGSELHLADEEEPTRLVTTGGSAGAPPPAWQGRPRRGGAARARPGSASPPCDDVVVALAASREGYGRLSSLISKGRLAVEKGQCRITTDDLCQAASGGGLVLLAGGPRSRAMRLLRERDREGAAGVLARLREAAGESLHVELVRHGAPGDLPRSRAMAALARDLGLPVVATNDVHFHERGRKPLHDVLRCIRDGVTLADAGLRLLPNAEAHLKSPRAMAACFKDLPEAVERAAALAAGIGFRLCEVAYDYPVRDVPPGLTADQFLAQIAREGLVRRLGPEQAARHEARLAKELALIADLQYAGYFLTMWDVVRECRARGILCQGRGSAANSLVCFATGITSVHPDEIDMLFERFVSKERHEPPDIDLDIEHEQREEIIQYVYQKYGRAHAAMVAEVIRYRRRSAVREVGKALGLSEAQLGRLTTFLSHEWNDLDGRALRAAGFDPESPLLERLFAFATALDGFPRHLSIHTGGFVLSDRPLAETVPIENGRMEDRTVVQWDKNDVDAMGMFKVDLLGLGMLSMIARAFDLLAAHRAVYLDLASIPPDDRPTYEMLANADSVGVFQVESRAQMNMLPRLRPSSFYDLVIEVAIVRPGPIHGQMVHPYLRRRRGLEPVTYPHPRLEPVLGRTLGVPLFQEQVMRIAEAVGGYTPGEADQLRRDMAAWRRGGRMHRHEAKLRAGMLASGIASEFVERIIEQIRGFGEYGFPESHAAAFAHLAYVSAYLKRHYPLEFACALLNAQPMGFYSVSVIVNDALRHGVLVRPPGVQVSDWDSTLEDVAPPASPPAGSEDVAPPASTPAGSRRFALRMGLRTVRSLGEEAGRALVAARRADGPFESVESLVVRAGVPRKALVSLAAAGALAGVPGHASRRHAIWSAAGVARDPGDLLNGASWPEARAALPPMRPLEEIAMDYHFAQASPGRHPIALERAALDRAGVLSARAFREAPGPPERATVAGLVITRQRPAAKGFVFLTLEDETGHVDVAVDPKTFRRFQHVIRFSPALLVRGRVVAEQNVRNVAGDWFAPLDLGGAPPPVTSHDFH